jgi:hypothetical protein
VILRGVAHVHSHYSWDGHHPLPEIAAFLRARGLDFVLMSEHTKGLEPTAFGEFVATCDALTDERLLVVPGLEFEATPDYVHVLGYGLRALSGAHDTAGIGRFVRESGGLAVLAHPTWRAAHAHLDASALALLDGWEVWNGKADGRWGPSAEGVERLGRAQACRAGLVAMGGLDMHNLEAYAGITLHVDAPARTGAAILDALRRGAYSVVGERVQFGPHDRPAVAGSAATAAGQALRRVKRWAERLDRKMGRAGLQAPASVYRLARRFLR